MVIKVHSIKDRIILEKKIVSQNKFLFFTDPITLVNYSVLFISLAVNRQSIFHRLLQLKILLGPSVMWNNFYQEIQNSTAGRDSKIT